MNGAAGESTLETPEWSGSLERLYAATAAISSAIDDEAALLERILQTEHQRRPLP